MAAGADQESGALHRSRGRGLEFGQDEGMIRNQMAQAQLLMHLRLHAPNLHPAETKRELVKDAATVFKTAAEAPKGSSHMPLIATPEKE